jgi:hypothetical protein
MKHIKVKTALKVARITANQARKALRVRTALKAGRITANHSRDALAFQASAIPHSVQ